MIEGYPRCPTCYRNVPFNSRNKALNPFFHLPLSSTLALSSIRITVPISEQVFAAELHSSATSLQALCA